MRHDKRDKMPNMTLNMKKRDTRDKHHMNHEHVSMSNNKLTTKKWQTRNFNNRRSSKGPGSGGPWIWCLCRTCGRAKTQCDIQNVVDSRDPAKAIAWPLLDLQINKFQEFDVAAVPTD